LYEQSGVDDAVVVSELVVFDWALVPPEVSGTVGTGPASWAPLPPHPAASDASTRTQMSALFMPWNLARAGNPVGPLR
jgi:hypothetical protein